MTSAPHSSVSTDSTTHKLVNRSSYVDDTMTITTLEEERCITMLEYERNRVKQYNYLNSHGFFGRRKKRASRPQPQPRPLPADSFRPPRMSAQPGLIPDDPDSTSMNSAPHSWVSTNSATHKVVNQFSYVDDSIMLSNSVRYFGGRTKKSAAKRRPRKPLPGYDKLPRMHPN